jgi:hypothetical protein
MTNFIPDQLIWWITAVDVPMITAFFIAFARLKRDVEHNIEQGRERLSAFKLTVAQNYASINHVKDLESRLIAHLLRIETKLDNTALKAHAVYVSPPHKEI